ncbi:hypothetical protein CPB85DRAFT_1435379 [Mucidula mucida]|nr:hypothetical protein CPB85DRAFT_1435379 [Mucidula mucida]
MSTTKPFVLIVGGAGQTGRVITKALLKEGKFQVALLKGMVSPILPDEELFARLKSTNVATKIVSEYFNSIYIRGDNTLTNAVADGSLDARKLYPDVPVASVEQTAKEFYANPPIPDYDLSSN